jgi:hypothetical protein
MSPGGQAAYFRSGRRQKLEHLLLQENLFRAEQSSIPVIEQMTDVLIRFEEDVVQKDLELIRRR